MTRTIAESTGGGLCRWAAQAKAAEAAKETT